MTFMTKTGGGARGGYINGVYSGGWRDIDPTTRDCPACTDGGFVVPFEARNGVIFDKWCTRCRLHFHPNDAAPEINLALVSTPA